MKNKHIYLGITLMALAMKRWCAYFTQMLASLPRLVENRRSFTDANGRKTGLNGQLDLNIHLSWCQNTSLSPDN